MTLSRVSRWEERVDKTLLLGLKWWKLFFQWYIYIIYYLRVSFSVGTDAICNKISPTVLVRSTWHMVSMGKGLQLAMITSPLAQNMSSLSSCSWFKTYEMMSANAKDAGTSTSTSAKVEAEYLSSQSSIDLMDVQMTNIGTEI